MPLIHGLVATGMAACCAVFTFVASLVYMPSELWDRGWGPGLLALLGALGVGLLSFAVLFVTFMVHGMAPVVVRRGVYCLVIGNALVFGVCKWMALQPASPVGF